MRAAVGWPVLSCVVLAAAAMLAAGPGSAPAGAAPSATSWQAAEAPRPAGATNGLPGADLTGLACPDAGHCVAVGSYTAKAGEQGLLDTQAGSSWSATRAPLPAHSGRKATATLVAVACPAQSRCVAVGADFTAAGRQGGLLLTWAGKKWRAVRARLPKASGGGRKAVVVDAVSCVAARSCVAVGDYITAAGRQRGLLLTLTGSGWHTVTAPLPGNAATGNAVVQLTSVSCPANAPCIAVGSYTDSGGAQRALVLTGHGYTWSAQEPQVPGSSTASWLSAVTCNSAASNPAGCAAVGGYQSADGTGYGLLLTGGPASLTAATAPMPGGGSSPAVQLTAVSCPSTAECIAVGQSPSGQSSARGLVTSGYGSSWQSVWLTMPSGVSSASPAVQLNSVSCPVELDCVIGGQYTDSAGHGQALLAGLGFSWGSVRAPLPANAVPVDGGSVGPAGPPAAQAVTCTSSSACTAVGGYQDSTSEAGLLLSGP